MASEIDVTEAWEHIEHELRPLPSESVALARASGRVLAEAVRTDRAYPPFDRASMDGFAVRSAEVAAASQTQPVALHVAGESLPGRPHLGAARPGTTVRIMTGAPLPSGWDCVVPVESTSGFDSEPVRVFAAARPGENVAPCGVERPAGETLFEPGHRLLAAETGLLAMVGRSEVRVGRLPRVAILSTGDELVPCEVLPGPSQIRNSNGPMLAALAAGAAEVEPLGICADRSQALDAALARGLAADLLLISGGVSMGAYDLVGEALATAGVRFHFRRVALQPGKPVLFGTHGRGAVLALPGNPVSTLVTFRLFVQPALHRLQGQSRVRPTWGRAGARFDWERRSDKWVVLPGRLVDGEVERVPYAGSGDLLAYARADCQIVLPRTLPRVVRGDPVPVWPL